MYGPGDYGVFHIQVYNGQGLNAQEANANKHVGARLSWPFELPGGRLFEVGMNAMHGMFVVNNGMAATGTTLFSFNESGNTGARGYLDQRLNWYIYWPPQPWGFIAEYSFGRGPERQANGGCQKARSVADMCKRIINGNTPMSLWPTSMPAIRSITAGLSSAVGAPSNNMNELEIGIAWQPDPQWEFTTAYTFTNRTNTLSTTPVLRRSRASSSLPTAI